MDLNGKVGPSLITVRNNLQPAKWGKHLNVGFFKVDRKSGAGGHQQPNTCLRRFNQTALQTSV